MTIYRRKSRALESKALDQAQYRARCRVTDGHGSLREAIEEWNAFEAGWPSLAQYVSRIAWLRAYRSAPHWRQIAEIEQRRVILRRMT